MSIIYIALKALKEKERRNWNLIILKHWIPTELCDLVQLDTRNHIVLAYNLQLEPLDLRFSPVCWVNPTVLQKLVEQTHLGSL